MNYFNRVNDSKILSQKDLSLPKAIICGDPLLIYGTNQNNRPPEIITDLRVKEVQYNKPMFLTFASSDTEGDNITMSMNGAPLPPDAGFSINTLAWIPNATQIGKEIPFAITARDVTNNNSYTEYFSIYVSHFDDSQFETLSGWQSSGNPELGRESIGTPFKTEKTRFIETSDSWGAISQTIQVEPQKNYLFSLFVANQLTQNNDSACIIIPELGERYPIIQQQSENELRIVKVAFNSGNQAQITITIASGSAQCPTSGKVFVAGSRLAECNLIAGDVTFDGSVDAVDALLMVRFLAGSVAFSDVQHDIADLNSDNFISVHDRQLVLYYSVGLISQVPVSMTIGDVNNDGVINILDYGEVYKYLNIGTPLSLIQKIAADVDGDEDVDVADMNLILDYHMNVINEFPYLKK
jgi:hypothetical protein